jgi:hypothetical protein
MAKYDISENNNETTVTFKEKGPYRHFLNLCNLKVDDFQVPADVMMDIKQDSLSITFKTSEFKMAFNALLP